MLFLAALPTGYHPAVIQAIVLAATLSATPKAATTTARPPLALAAIPDEAVVFGLRRARIAAEAGDREGQRALLDALATAHPDDPTVLAATLAFHRDTDGESDATRALRGRLIDALSQPDRVVPLSLLQDMARDTRASDEELSRLVLVLASQPGTGADRIARLRLRVALLDRLNRQADMLVSLDELAMLDADPLVAFRLLDQYRKAGRWEDVLRVTAKIEPSQTGFDAGWWRVDALGALGRYDDMVNEANAIIARWRPRAPRSAAAESTPIVAPSLQPPTAADPAGSPAVGSFFPMVFQLLDVGRRDSAEQLVVNLEAARPDADDVERLHVMLFGSPEDRSAFLASLAGAVIASADPDKIRAEAYKRLLAKDYATAHDLYRRLLELDPTGASLDGTDWFNYGLASIETAAWQDAETAMTRVLATGTSTPRAYAHRARARVMLGREVEGIADAEAALAIDPKLKQACYAMYLAYQKFGDKERADAWLARSKAP